MSYRLFVDVSRSNAQRLLFLTGERFMDERKLLAELTRPGMSVVDVGANIGYYALALAGMVGQAGRIVCFEPEPDNAEELRRNISRNGIANVFAIEAAVGADGGTALLACGINGMIVRDGGPGTDRAVRVPMVTLDSTIRDKVDLIKIDVEGEEGAVLEGAREIIARHRPILFIEVHPWLLHEDHSAEDILRFVAQFYTDVQFFEKHRKGSTGKVLSLYGGAPIARVTDTGALLGACEKGERWSPYWMVCRA